MMTADFEELKTLGDVVKDLEHALGTENFLKCTLRLKVGKAPNDNEKYTLYMEVHSPCDRQKHETCTIPYILDCHSLWDTSDEAKKAGEELGKVFSDVGAKVVYSLN